MSPCFFCCPSRVYRFVAEKHFRKQAATDVTISMDLNVGVSTRLWRLDWVVDPIPPDCGPCTGLEVDLAETLRLVVDECLQEPVEVMGGQRLSCWACVFFCLLGVFVLWLWFLLVVGCWLLVVGCWLLVVLLLLLLLLLFSSSLLLLFSSSLLLLLLLLLLLWLIDRSTETQ